MKVNTVENLNQILLNLNSNNAPYFSMNDLMCCGTNPNASPDQNLSDINDVDKKAFLSGLIIIKLSLNCFQLEAIQLKILGLTSTILV